MDSAMEGAASAQRLPPNLFDMDSAAEVLPAKGAASVQTIPPGLFDKDSATGGSTVPLE